MLGAVLGDPGAAEVNTEPRCIPTIMVRQTSAWQTSHGYLTSEFLFLVKDPIGDRRSAEDGYSVVNLPTLNYHLEVHTRNGATEQRRQREQPLINSGTRKRTLDEAKLSEHHWDPPTSPLALSDDHDQVLAQVRALGTMFIDRTTTVKYAPQADSVVKQQIPLGVLFNGDQRWMRNLWRYRPNNGDRVFYALKRARLVPQEQGFISDEGRQSSAQATLTEPLQVVPLNRRDGARVLHCSPSNGVPTDDDFDYIEQNKRFAMYTKPKTKRVDDDVDIEYLDWELLSSGARDDDGFVMDCYQMGSPLVEIEVIRFAQKKSKAEGRQYARDSSKISAADRSKFDGLINVSTFNCR